LRCGYRLKRSLVQRPVAVFDEDQDSVTHILVACIKPAKRGVSIKPGVKQSEPQDRRKMMQEPAERATVRGQYTLRYRTLRALSLLT
jgi:hypothetical protein